VILVDSGPIGPAGDNRALLCKIKDCAIDRRRGPEGLLKEPEDSRIRVILMRHLARLHLELKGHPSGRPPIPG
jgi:hypothetical protein